MKKLALILLIPVLSILVIGCGDTKEALNSETFQESLKVKNFTVVDETTLVANQSSIESYFVATHPSNFYKLEFYIFNSEAAAQSYYVKERDTLGGQGSYNELNVGNFSKYTQICNGKYSIVSRVGSTVLYSNVDDVYRNEVNILLKEIGY